jgi:hypothetical protein
MWGQLDAFLHLTPWPKIMWYNFIFLIFFKVNCKKTSSNQDFFLSQLFYRRAPEFPVTKQSWKSRELIGRDYSNNFEFFLRRTNRLDIKIWTGLFTSPGGSIVILEIRVLKFESHGRQYRIFHVFKLKRTEKEKWWYWKSSPRPYVNVPGQLATRPHIKRRNI